MTDAYRTRAEGVPTFGCRKVAVIEFIDVDRNKTRIYEFTPGIIKLRPDDSSIALNAEACRALAVVLLRYADTGELDIPPDEAR